MTDQAAIPTEAARLPRARGRVSRWPDRGLMGDGGMAAIELGVAMVALAAAILLAAGRG